MLYFAYGSNLNVTAVSDWCKLCGYKCPVMRTAQKAVLDNYRLCFPVYSEYFGGGTGDIVYDPGKYVAGALFDLTEAEMTVLDAKVGRRLDSTGAEVGIYKRSTVLVSPLVGNARVEAVTYQAVAVEKFDIPPTKHYMSMVVQGAYAMGLSMMWIAYLQSFPTQEGRKPRAPSTK
jgi:hypothetical protein